MANFVALVFVGFLLLLLGAIVRFSIISPLMTRGARGRLRNPDPAGVAKVCGFAPPPELVQLYRRAPYLERMEFQLVDGGRQPPLGWEVGRFLPLAPRDIREARRIHGVRDGMPIASDLDNGVYVMLRDGAVVLRSPNVPGGQVPVASSAAELSTFVARDDAEIEVP